MAYRTQLSGYVKFLRGTPAAWESIETKDADTLYFIAENNSSRGTLYLGNKLISSGVNNTYYLGDLEDVLINSGIPSDAVLVYNTTSQKWEPMALATALASIVSPMTGATAENDGLAGLVPQPLAGEQGLFLRGDGEWADPTSSLRTFVNGKFDDLYGNDSGTIRSIAQSLINDLVGNAPASLDTLEELATWVSNHEEVLDIAQAAEDIENLSNAMFGTLANPSETNADLVAMMQDEGVIRILSNLNTIILGTEEQQGLQTKVNGLSSQVDDNTAAIASLNSAMTTVNSRIDAVESDIETLENRVRWTDVVEDNE